MMDQIEYAQLSLVLETWDIARFRSNNNNFEQAFGMVVLNKLFELKPRAKKPFGYDEGEEKGKKGTQIHAVAFAGLLNTVFQMLGPDLDFINDILEQLGRRHKAMGVSPSYFPYMGIALIHALEEFLERSLTKEERDSWTIVFEIISSKIIKAMVN